ncbi:MAG: alpha/beta family hydrolase [Acidimicrobiales bacterium]
MVAPSALLLTHGAGGDSSHRLLVAMEDRLELPVRRMDFPYRREGRRAPDRAPKLIDAVRTEVAVMAEEMRIDPDRIAFAGRSMGGRICSMAIAEGLAASGLVLLSYPLHPVGKPEKLRIDHFPDIAVPTLFVNGDRDPFGTPEELDAHIGAIAGPTQVHWLEGQRHDPKPAFDDEIISVVGAFLAGL